MLNIHLKLLSLLFYQQMEFGHVWVKHCRTSGYGVINVQYPLTTAWSVTHAHRLSYIVFNRQYNNINGLDVSHLCHNRSCVLASHLVLEPHATNCSRTKCMLRGVCQGHGPHPDCMLQYAVNNNIWIWKVIAFLFITSNSVQFSLCMFNVILSHWMHNFSINGGGLQLVCPIDGVI